MNTPRRSVDVPGAALEPDHLGDPATTVSVWNLANGLTVLRLLLVPVFLVAFVQHGGNDTGWRIAAGVIFGIASITDRIDGEVARRRGLITEFGKLADPIADKALMGSALIGLSAQDRLAWWVTAIVLGREIGITLLRFWVIRHGVIPASRGGKLKTFVQAFGIGFLILPLHGGWHLAAEVIMAVAVVLTVVTAFDYIGRALAMRRSPKPAALG